MKYLSFLSFAALLACSGNPSSENPQVPEIQYSYFGDSIATQPAVPADSVVSILNGKDSVEITIAGEIAEVCQMKGCWMDMAIGSDTMTVRFKDYQFFVPKDAAGKKTVIAGVVERKVESVEWLRHKAQDAGKSQEEIDAIAEDQVRYSFTAHGVAIAN